MNSDDSHTSVDPEFSRPVRFSGIERDGRRAVFAARKGERAALALRFDLDAITLLKADLELRQDRPGLIYVIGTFEAEFTIRSPDSDDPVEFMVSDTVDEIFVTRPGLDFLSRVDREAMERAEDVEDDSIDLGELVAQYLALALDPALIETGSLDADAVVNATGPDDSSGGNPFSVLAQFRARATDGVES